ncbi:MAG: hypothetical protein ACKVOH_02655 [Chlamydiales bacterium]
MRTFAISFLLLATIIPLKANEITVMEELIRTTEKNLEGQKRLLKYLIEFQKARNAFVEESSSSKLGAILVRCAMHVHRQMEHEHLAHLFSPEFLEEIRFFNQVGSQAIKGRS